MIFISVLFWLSLLGSVYSYLVYPLILMLRQRRKRSSVEPTIAPTWPKVSIIIPVHNAADIIANKIDTTLDLDYPKELLEILIVSDGSTDGTDKVVQGYSDRSVRLIQTLHRCGKEEAQRVALGESSGEILVFSDVGTVTPPESLKALIVVFSDMSIGAASSEDKFIAQEGSPKGEGMYVRYEMWLRRLESERATLVGLSGSYFAARRVVCEDWNTAVPSDFNVAIECARKQLRAVSVPEANGVYMDVAEPSQEYRRKVRTVVRGMRGLLVNRMVLNPFRYGFFSIQMWSHKVMRWAMPWFLISVFLLSGVLSIENTLFLYFFIIQTGVYILAVGSQIFPFSGEITLLRILQYIGTVNIAILNATFLVFMGRRMTTWEPTKRQPRSPGQQE